MSGIDMKATNIAMLEGRIKEAEKENAELKDSVLLWGLNYFNPKEASVMLSKQKSDITEPAEALKETAVIISLNVDFDIQKSVPDKYKALANKHLKGE